MKTLEYKFATDKGKKRFLQLNDLHIANHDDAFKIRKITSTILQNIESDGAYDAFFIAGDLTDSTNTLHNEYLLSVLLDFIHLLGKLAPTFLATGNHDLCSLVTSKNCKKGWRKDEQTFQNKIIDVIKTFEGVVLCETGTYNLDGEYSVSIYNPSIEYMLSSLEKRETVLQNDEENYRFLLHMNPSKTNILICHYPDVLKYLHRKGYLEKIRLALAGHNHNGMTQFLFLETILNALGQKNRGLITPDQQLLSAETAEVRGLIHLDGNCDLYIGPAVTSLAPNTGFLRHFNFMFYEGMSEISFEPSKKLELTARKKSQ